MTGKNVDWDVLSINTNTFCSSIHICRMSWWTRWLCVFSQNVSEYYQEISQSHIADHGTVRKNNGILTVIGHQDDNYGKAISLNKVSIYLNLSLPAQDDFNKVMHNKTKAKHRTPTNNGRYLKHLNQQRHNKRLRTGHSLSHWGLKCIWLAPNLRPRCCCCYNTNIV